MLSIALASVLLTSTSPLTDELVLVSGKVMEVERVTSETYKEVVYKTLGGSDGRKSADQIQAITHDTGSPLLDDYVQAIELLDAGDFQQAIVILEEVLKDDRLIGKARYGWVQQHALYQIARAYFSMGEVKTVAETVDRLLKVVPDTFFYGVALKLKAEALSLAGSNAEARKVFEQLSADVARLGLPERWEREAELGQILLDGALKGPALERKLAQLVEKNRGAHPTVASRANVEIGNSMIQQGDFAGAEQFFRRIIDSGQADDRTMAAAYSGVGDCAYQRGLVAADSGEASAGEAFKEAFLAHLRVITMHKDVVTQVPRSLYFAAMSFHRRGDEEDRARALQLAGYAGRHYPNSPWTAKVYEDLSIRR